MACICTINNNTMTLSGFVNMQTSLSQNAINSVSSVVVNNNTVLVGTSYENGGTIYYYYYLIKISGTSITESHRKTVFTENGFLKDYYSSSLVKINDTKYINFLRSKNTGIIYYQTVTVSETGTVTAPNPVLIESSNTGTEISAVALNEEKILVTYGGLSGFICTVNSDFTLTKQPTIQLSSNSTGTSSSIIKISDTSAIIVYGRNRYNVV